ncbi:BREX-2 system phosphatase PglZ [Arthrobacter rhombi]|uniref:BREX-2 system phosphatase PglZ n=1 Tax=Arthrobacter rhombi TaxID=71253 RepID=UPI003FD259D7
MNTDRIPLASKALVAQKARTLLASPTHERILVLRSRPEWDHEDVLIVDGQEISVIPGISQLGILESLVQLEPGQQAVILTDRPRNDLGDTILTLAYGQDVQIPEEWGAVPGLFPGASEVSRDLRAHKWAATALLDHAPVTGWAPSQQLAVTAKHALGGLLAHLLGFGMSTDLDQTMLLTQLDKHEVRAAWTGIDPTLRKNLIHWAGEDLGPTAAFALRVAQHNEHIGPLPVALALDVLWPADDDPVPEQVAARVRVEKYLGGKSIDPGQARAVARMARTVVLRLDAARGNDGALVVPLMQATALLDDIGWAAGAERSLILHAGLIDRLRILGTALDRGTSYEEAFADLLEHREGPAAAEAPRMAVRLARWLQTPEATTSSFVEDLSRQMLDGSWVDDAIGVLWAGSDDQIVSASYMRLVEKVRARRKHRDQVAAGRINQVEPWNADKSIDDVRTDVMGIEDVLRAVVAPWKNRKNTGGTLVVVLDGMSAAIANQVVAETSQFGLMEWVPTATKQRLAVAAALPSLTEVSRTSLWSGRIILGDARTEARHLSVAFPGATMFHKNDLRAPAGAALPQPVIDALQAEPRKVPVVGVVINVIDDATHRTDMSGQKWGIDSLAPLPALLRAAVAAGRTIVLTSDHGHVVERETQQLFSSGNDSRWRPADSGPARTGEILVSGPRVSADGSSSAVLLSSDDTHYGPRAAGYHGGASLAEITVPVVVLQAATIQAGATGWSVAPLQQPIWWNERTSISERRPAQQNKRRKDTPVANLRSDPSAQDSDRLFELEEVVQGEDGSGGVASADLVGRLLGSPIYVEQKVMAKKASEGADELVSVALRVLLTHNGRAHQNTVAVAVGVQSGAMPQILAKIRRLLNVDGYPVIEADADGTIRLDTSLLVEQFAL